MTTRTLTLLFTDMVKSTATLARLPEREAHRVRQQHLGAVREQVERHFGREVKSLGDGVMAAFDSARLAIEAAVAIQLATPETIRVGVSSGDVDVDGADCFGMPVVEASRLCHRAAADQVLVAESTRLLARTYEPLRRIGDLRLKGLPAPTSVWEAVWSHTTALPIRAVLADDAALVRAGLARVLEESGIEVVGQARDATELLRLAAELQPDLAIVDVRMPPTHTTEGLVAAERLLRDQPRTGVLVLSQDTQPHYAQRLLDARATGVGYLLKELVADVRELVSAARSVASGGQAFVLQRQVNNNGGTADE